MTRTELLELKRQDMRDFMESWREEQALYGGWVPARKLHVTGIILHELVEAGKVETDGFGYRPS